MRRLIGPPHAHLDAPCTDLCYEEVDVRAPGQSFESCPAATGQPDQGIDPCPQFPDGAHRCGSVREPHTYHRCTCGKVWQSVALLLLPVPNNPSFSILEDQ